MQKTLCIVDHIARERNKSSLSALLRYLTDIPKNARLIVGITLCVFLHLYTTMLVLHGDCSD